MFVIQYLETAEWADGPEGASDFYWSPEALERATADCERFIERAGDLVSPDPSQAAHDFWLTRNGHGAGFWDGDWPEPAATVLTALADKFGPCELYIGDDGLAHFL